MGAGDRGTNGEGPPSPRQWPCCAAACLGLGAGLPLTQPWVGGGLPRDARRGSQQSLLGLGSASLGSRVGTDQAGLQKHPPQASCPLPGSLTHLLCPCRLHQASWSPGTASTSAPHDRCAVDGLPWALMTLPRPTRSPSSVPTPTTLGRFSPAAKVKGRLASSRVRLMYPAIRWHQNWCPMSSGLRFQSSLRQRSEQYRTARQCWLWAERVSGGGLGSGPQAGPWGVASATSLSPWSGPAAGRGETCLRGCSCLCCHHPRIQRPGRRGRFGEPPPQESTAPEVRRENQADSSICRAARCGHPQNHP